MNVVLDANIIVSGSLWGGNPGRVLDHCIAGKLTNWVSPEIIEELERVLSYEKFKLTREEILSLVRLVVSFSKIVVPKERVHEVRKDPGDDKYLECALTCDADAIISGDKHLLALCEYERIRIMTAKEILDELKA